MSSKGFHWKPQGERGKRPENTQRKEFEADE